MHFEPTSEPIDRRILAVTVDQLKDLSIRQPATQKKKKIIVQNRPGDDIDTIESHRHLWRPADRR